MGVSVCSKLGFVDWLFGTWIWISTCFLSFFTIRFCLLVTGGNELLLYDIPDAYGRFLNLNWVSPSVSNQVCSLANGYVLDYNYNWKKDCYCLIFETLNWFFRVWILTVSIYFPSLFSHASVIYDGRYDSYMLVPHVTSPMCLFAAIVKSCLVEL